MKRHFYIGIGGNLGDPATTLPAAVERLRAIPGLTVDRVSSYRWYPAVGGPANQPDYLNAVLELSTEMSPTHLLATLLRVERDFGRDRAREQRFGPRVLDLDILLAGDLKLDQPGLVVPHPRMHERLFVLEPLAEMAPEALHPVLRKTIAELRDGTAAKRR